MNKTLRQIADYHILNGYLCPDFSLMGGKMGVVLFFLFYARHTQNCWYEEFADDLLDDVCSNLNVNLPTNFANGLCGIGWSIEFMKRQGFIDDDTDEILSEIDHRIMEWDLRRISDTSLESGLEGIVVYVRSRLDTTGNTSNRNIFDSAYLEDLENACQKNNIQWHDTDYDVNSIWNRVIESYSTLSTDSYDWRIAMIIMKERAWITLK